MGVLWRLMRWHYPTEDKAEDSRIEELANRKCRSEDVDENFWEESVKSARGRGVYLCLSWEKGVMREGFTDWRAYMPKLERGLQG